MQIWKNIKPHCGKAANHASNTVEKDNYLTYRDLFWLVRKDPDPELMLLFIICSRKSCILASKRLYSVKKETLQLISPALQQSLRKMLKISE